MVDTWATVGSCAQMQDVICRAARHRRRARTLAGNPTIIEDNCFLYGRRAPIIVEGVIVGKPAGHLDGRFIGQSTESTTGHGSVSYGHSVQVRCCFRHVAVYDGMPALLAPYSQTLMRPRQTQPQRFAPR